MAASMGITFDTSELDNLADLLATAREKPKAVRAEALGRVGDKVKAEAEAIAQAYPDPLDELAGNVEMESTPLTRRIFTSKRQGAFLEFGSPNTGAPRPWLTGPAQKGADELFEELSKAAELW